MNDKTYRKQSDRNKRKCRKEQKKMSYISMEKQTQDWTAWYRPPYNGLMGRSKLMEKHYCIDCIYRNIQETSHEWIECICKADGHTQSPYDGCDKWEGEQKND